MCMCLCINLHVLHTRSTFTFTASPTATYLAICSVMDPQKSQIFLSMDPKDLVKLALQQLVDFKRLGQDSRQHVSYMHFSFGPLIICNGELLFFRFRQQAGYTRSMELSSKSFLLELSSALTMTSTLFKRLCVLWWT